MTGRTQESLIRSDSKKKIVFVVGPRQVGKTWLAQQIGKSFDHTVYLNYDSLEDRRLIEATAWLDTTQLLILDELHKMRGWKNFLKGVYDTKSPTMQILVTGSARLDTFLRGGDSLAGRFFSHRLLPFSLSELKETSFAGEIDRLMNRGGFPEPFLAEDDVDADRWRRQYVDELLRVEILNFQRIQDLRAMEGVLNLLQRGVGSPVSYASIARDLNLAPNTVKKYIQILEALFIVFRVTPFSKNVSRSLLKAPKIYFYDNGFVNGDAGAKFENFVAISLLKHVMSKTDATGKRHALCFIRTKDHREVDFCLVEEGVPYLLLETKFSDPTINPALFSFSQRHKIPALQLVRHLRRESQKSGVKLRLAANFLQEL